MLVNDSVTVATEVPVLLDKEDLLHYQQELTFNVPLSLEEEEVITGHIDLIQVRKGMIHIMDYKPSARKVKPIDQLILYALALSRLTTLRLFHFKCAWFDEECIVYKKKKRRARRESAKVGERVNALLSSYFILVINSVFTTSYAWTISYGMLGRKRLLVSPLKSSSTIFLSRFLK